MTPSVFPVLSIPNDVKVIFKNRNNKKTSTCINVSSLAREQHNIYFVNHQAHVTHLPMSNTCAVSIPGRYSDELLALVLAPAVTEV